MKIDWIEPDVLAASGIPIGEYDIQMLYGQGIRAIVTLTEQPLTIQRGITLELLHKLGISTLHVAVVDQHPPTEQQVQQVHEFIEDMRAQNKPVFIHCHAGIGRTGTMLHAYYLAAGLSLEDAKQKVKSGRRSSAFLMLTDLQQAFLKDLAGKNTVKRTSKFHGSRFINNDGVRLSFIIEDDNSVIGTIFLDETTQGPPTLVHGGALATTTAAFEANRMGLTANLNVDYRAPVPLETTVTVTARVDHIEDKKTFLVGKVILPDGTVAAEGRGLFIFNQVMNDGLHAALEG
jgi:atypical dual specificity phosphatase